MEFFIYNGKLVKKGTAILQADNRGLRYGDGLFETVKHKNGQVILSDEHFARMWHGMKLLEYDIPKLFTPELLETSIASLVQKNKHKNARIRITVTRGNGGLYDLQNNSFQYTIETWDLPQGNGELNSNGIETAVYKDAIKTIDKFSALKHNNFLPYVMGALFAKKNKLNDAFLLNQHGRICDSTIANIFLVCKDELITPPTSEGCIAGVMRNEIIATLKQLGIKVTESPVTEPDLLNADEVFLTNSISNIRWVKSVDSKQYPCKKTAEIYQLLQETKADVFC